MTTLYRTARTMPTVIGYEFADADGEDVAVATNVVATATSAAGNTIVLPAVSAGSGGLWNLAFPGVATLDQVVVTWSAEIDGHAVSDTDIVEITGGHYFGLREARRDIPDLTAIKFSTAFVRERRVEIEEEFEGICGRSFLPRYRRVTLDGTDDNRLYLPDADVSRIRSVSLLVDGTPVAFTDPQLAELVLRPDDRSIARPSGALWPLGAGNVVIGYDYGMTRPPSDLKRVALVRLRSRVMMLRSGIPDRALSWSNQAGETYRLSIPAAYRTGVPEVDGVLDRYSLRPSDDDGTGTGGGGNAAPASRTLNYDPQRYSLFHGGQR